MAENHASALTDGIINISLSFHTVGRVRMRTLPHNSQFSTHKFNQTKVTAILAALIYFKFKNKSQLTVTYERQVLFVLVQFVVGLILCEILPGVSVTQFSQVILQTISGCQDLVRSICICTEVETEFIVSCEKYLINLMSPHTLPLPGRKCLPLTH